MMAGLILAACHSAKPAGPRLELSVQPPVLKAGVLVQVTARPVPGVQLAWVSGTVKVMGAPVAAFKEDKKEGVWRFKTMVPAFASVPKGSYKVKAWGRTRTGEEVLGEMDYEAR